MRMLDLADSGLFKVDLCILFLYLAHNLSYALIKTFISVLIFDITVFEYF